MPRLFPSLRPADAGRAVGDPPAGRSVLWILLVAAVLWPRPSEAQWDREIDWLIPCTALIVYELDSSDAICDDVHRPEISIKAVLDDASLWLERLGFASPAVSTTLDLGPYGDGEEWRRLQRLTRHQDPRCKDRYCAWLVFGLPGRHGAYSWPDSSLVLDPFRIEGDSLEPGYARAFGFSEVHELFHAVQAGYPETAAARDNSWVEWILEGSAEHVRRVAEKRKALSVGSPVSLRSYDQPLHVPPNENRDSPEFQEWSYGSWEFFEFLGDDLGSTDGVQYLDPLFDTLAPGQNNGLEAVDATVRRGSDEGLYDAFPEFVARRLDRPCYFSHLGEWNGFDCAEGPDNEHRFELAFPDTIRRLDHTSPAMGANGYLVRTEIPEGEDGTLIIRVPPDRDAEYLHLVVDDERRDEPGPLEQRNAFTKGVSSGRHEFLVRLANVPRDPAGADVSAGLDFGDPAPIEFMLEKCTVPIDGTYEGRLGGPLARQVEAKSGSGTAKITRRRGPADPTGAGHPLGEWHMLLDSRVKWGDDLDIAVYFDGPFEPGRSVVIEDVGMLDAAIAGGVSEPERVSWSSGTVRITFVGVTDHPGSGDRGVCGEITADLVGLKDPPPGGTRPVEVPASFSGEFRAVWRQD